MAIGLPAAPSDFHPVLPPNGISAQLCAGANRQERVVSSYSAALPVSQSFSCCNACEIRFIELKMSASVVKRPMQKRIEAAACSCVRPIARNTWEGSEMPDMQAEPVEAAKRGCNAPRI